MIHNKYFELLNFFLDDYGKEIYGREISEKVSFSQKNVASTLDEMGKLDILTFVKKGNMKYYSLNRKNKMICRYLIMAEIRRAVIFFEKHLKLAKIFEEIRFDSVVLIFGSYAKGTEKKDSDLDLFVVGNVDEGKIRKRGRDFGIDISIKNGSNEDFVKLIREGNLLMNEILKNHVLVFGVENFVDEVITNKW